MYKNKIYLILIIILLGISAIYYFTKREVEVVEPPVIAVTDGPYVFNEQKDLVAYWLCNGVVEQESLDKNNLPLSLNYCDLSANIFATEVTEDNVLIYSGDFKVAALSDFHGQYDLMNTLLTNNKIIDQQGNWSFGNGHFVITGDVFDRGDKVTEILWFLYKLEKQALELGGQVHLLLGNHEVMILNGDLRYLHPKYVETAKKLNKPFEQLFSKTSILGNWLRSKPVLVKVNNMLFAHGGFHPSLAKEKRTLVEINTVFKENLVKAEMPKERDGWGKYLHKTNGPIWYRGYFAKEREKTSSAKGSQSKTSRSKDKGATSAEIDMLLKHFDVQHLIVGHTSQQQIETRYQGRVIAIDSSIKRGQYGEILLIEKANTNSTNKMWRGSLTGEKLPLNN